MRTALQHKNWRTPFFKGMLTIAGFMIMGGVLLASSFAGTTTGTFGKTNIGGTCDTFVNDLKRVNEYNLDTSASITQLSVYLQPGTSTGSQSIVGVLYADSNGSPHSLLAKTSPLSYTNTEKAAWYTLPFAAPVPVTAGKYWIGVLTGDTSRVIGYCYDQASSNTRDYNSNSYNAGPSDPFGTTNSDNRSMSLYATYILHTPDPVPTVSLTASPDTIQSGSSSLLSWTASNASNCSATWTSSTSTSGSQTVAPSSSTDYRITCSGPGGNTTAQTTVTVTTPPPPSGGTSGDDNGQPPSPSSESPTPEPLPEPTQSSDQQSTPSQVLPDTPLDTPVPPPTPSPTPPAATSSYHMQKSLPLWQQLLAYLFQAKLLIIELIIATAIVGFFIYMLLRHPEWLRKLLHRNDDIPDTPLTIPPAPFL